MCSDESVRHEGVELPMEEDGTLLLSVLQSQFEGASGLKYRSALAGGKCMTAIRDFGSNGGDFPFVR